MPGSLRNPKKQASNSRSAVLRAARRFPFREPATGNSTAATRGALLALLTASAIFGIMLGLMLVYSINLPEMKDLERYRPSATTELYDIHGRVFGSFALERRVVEPYSEFPSNLREVIFFNRRQKL